LRRRPIISTFFPYTTLFRSLENTVEGFLVGEDITSGRTILYDYALKLFYDNPVFGIGWRKFNDLTFGLLSDNTGSHPHNIYLQRSEEHTSELQSRFDLVCRL